MIKCFPQDPTNNKYGLFVKENFIPDIFKYPHHFIKEKVEEARKYTIENKQIIILG